MSRNKNFILRVAWVAGDASRFDVDIQPANAPKANRLAIQQAALHGLEHDRQEAATIFRVQTSVRREQPL